MKVIIHEWKDDDSRFELYYRINKKGEFIFRQVEYRKGILVTPSTLGLIINTDQTKRLFNYITEEEIKNKFGNEDGFYDFQDWCKNHNVKFDFTHMYLIELQLKHQLRCFSAPFFVGNYWKKQNFK